jgi:two-component system sensor histidine kinase DegS
MRMQSHLEVLVFRAVQELLANVREHAQATQVKMTVDVDTNQVRVGVEDNGKGFDPDGAGFTGGQGRGLKTLKERIDLVGGSMEITTAAGKGTKISLVVPT